ncbi:MAG: Hpt domain-containing protein [Acidobacteria bacterium]|nr:Hpt domain-containing protein [Acidobacteriota bacterium]
MADGRGARLERDRLEREFFAEMEEIFDALAADLRALAAAPEKGRPCQALINPIFRGVHSLKGIAGSLGFHGLADLAHAFEDLLDRLRLGRADLTRETIGLMESSVDALFHLARDVRHGTSAARDFAELRARLHAGAAAPPSGAGADPLDSLALDPGLRSSLSQYEEGRLRERLRAGGRVYLARLRLDPQRFDEQIREVTREVGRTLEVLGVFPDPVAAAPGPAPEAVGFAILAAGEAFPGSRGGAIAGVPVEATEIGPALPAGSEEGIAPPAADGVGDLHGLSGSLRVPVERLDEVLAQVGDLSMAAMALQRSARAARDAHPGDRALRDLEQKIGALLLRLRPLQRSAVKIRLVPLGQVFNRLARLVDRTARAAGKEVDLRTLGGEVEIDKAVMDELATPLMHLLLNALDHGIELPHKRARAGKPARGRLVLSAFQRGGHALIEMSDDGGGIDLAAVRAAAEAAGRLAPGAPLSRAEAHEMIFAPGFSTARTVSRVSGRGVGLDVARRAIRRLKGSIQTRSIEGHGTTFTVTVPVSLVLVPALIVRAGGQRFAIPIGSVRENVRLEPSRLRRVDGIQVYDHPRGPLPLVRFEDLIPSPSDRPETPPGGYAVVAGPPGRPVGIVVDGFIGRQEIIIKPIGGLLEEVPGLAGAADLGDAVAVLVLDPESLVVGEPHGGPVC